MYLSDCWAYERGFRATLRPVNGHVALHMRVGDGPTEVSLTLSRDQILQVRDAINLFVATEAERQEGTRRN